MKAKIMKLNVKDLRHIIKEEATKIVEAPGVRPPERVIAHAIASEINNHLFFNAMQKVEEQVMKRIDLEDVVLPSDSSDVQRWADAITQRVIEQIKGDVNAFAHNFITTFNGSK